MVTESTGVLILSPREVGTGSPVGASLENIITNPIANGALCYVASGVAQGEWQLDKSSTAAPDGILVIAPIAGPGRWLKMNGGGGGGGVTGVTGAGSITTTNPTGPVVTVDGTALLARNGSNGGMTADLDMGGNDIQNAISVSSAAGLALTGATSISATATTGNATLSATTGNVIIGAATGSILISTATADIDVLSTGDLRLRGGGTNADQWPATNGTVGQVLTIQSAGSPNVLAWTTPSSGGTPAAPDRSIQFNNAGAFGGSARLTYNSPGTGPVVRIQSSSNTDSLTGLEVLDSSAALGGRLSYNDNTGSFILSGQGNTGVVSATGSLALTALTGPASLTGTSITLDAGTPLIWPTTDGTSGQAIVTNGAGVLGWASIPAAGVPVPLIDNITTGPGPTPIANTMFTHARVNYAGAINVVLPAPTVGKQITVKDVSGNAATHNITVTPTSGTIDTVGSYIIATNRGSATFICVSTSPEAWDVV